MLEVQIGTEAQIGEDFVVLPGTVLLREPGGGSRIITQADLAAQGGGIIIPSADELAKRRAKLDDLMAGFNERSAILAGKLRDGGMGIEAWQQAMRKEIKDLHIASAIVSKGGDRSQLTYADWGRVGGFLTSQYRYLYRYALAIQDKAAQSLATGVPFFSEKYLAYRSRLYGGHAKAGFYQGLAEGLLPQAPGDGNTQCLTNCQCTLRFEQGDVPGVILVFWELHPAEHCDDCVSLSQSWNPLELWLPGAEVQ